MKVHNLTDKRLVEALGRKDFAVDDVLNPILELSEDSPSLLVGYGSDQSMVRERLIPYFHLLGAKTTEPQLRVLIVGGWLGTETKAAYTVARLVALFEAKLQLIDGLEITAYPIMNLEAYKSGVLLTPKQELEGVKLWSKSPCSHVVVLERELLRYPYDLVVFIREDDKEIDLSVNLWAETDRQRLVGEDHMKRFSRVSPFFRWAANPVSGLVGPIAGKVPDQELQPVEARVGLPAALPDKEQTDSGIAITLGFLHAYRQARMEGIL